MKMNRNETSHGAKFFVVEQFSSIYLSIFTSILLTCHWIHTLTWQGIGLYVQRLRDSQVGIKAYSSADGSDHWIFVTTLQQVCPKLNSAQMLSHHVVFCRFFLKSFRFDFGIHFRQLGPYNGLPSPENRRYPELLWDMWMLWSQSRSSEPKFRWIFGITPNGLWSPPSRPHFEKLFCVFLRNTKICNKKVWSEPHVFLKIPWRKVLVSNTKIWIRILYSVKKDHSKKFYSSAITDFCAKHALKLNSTNGCKI